MHVIFKRKVQIFSFFLATLLVVSAYALRNSQPSYQSTAQVRPEQGREFVSDLRLDTLGAVRAPIIKFNQEEQLDFAIGIITGRSLAERVVTALGPLRLYPRLAENGWLDRLLSREPASPEGLKLAAVDELLKHLSASKVSKASVIEIAFRHAEPLIAAEVVNTLVELYVDRHLGIRKSTRSDQFFQEQFSNIKASLGDAEQSLRDFKRSLNISSSLDEERQLLIGQINRLRADHDDTLSEQVETDNRIAQLRKQLQHTAQDPAGISMLRERLLELQIKESELQLNYNSDSRTLDNLRSEIGSLQSRLRQLGGDKRYGSNAGPAGSLYAQLQAEMLKAEADLSALRARQQVVSGQLRTLQRRLSELDAAENEYAVLEQQVRSARDNNSLYLTKLQELRISEAMDAERISGISVIEPGRPALEPMNSKLPLLLALGVFVGLAGGVCLAFVLELLNKTIDRREEVENELGLPVLASVPDYSPKPG